MKDDAKVLSQFSRHLHGFFASTALQRQEIHSSFAYRDCHQWAVLDQQERDRLNKTTTIINLAAPLIRAVSGTEVMQDKKLDFVALDDGLDADADAISDAVGYAQYASGYDAEQSMAREDAATCGIGATVTWLDMSHKNAIAGRPIVERVFPGFLFYDNSSRGARLNERARWCGYAEAVNAEDMDERIAKVQGEGGEAECRTTTISPMGSGGDFSGYLTTFIRNNVLMNTAFVFHYFWWDYETIYDVANPYAGEANVMELISQHDEDILKVMDETTTKLRIDWRAPWWCFTEDEFKEFKDILEFIEDLTGIEVMKLRSSKREGKCYYKAQIARGVLIEKEKCYTQNGFPLNFITGYFDETQNIYYGMMRPLSYVQDALNLSMSDFLGYVRTASHGGNAYIKGAGDAFEKIKEKKAHEDAITPLPANAEVIAKSLPSTPQALVDFIRLMMEIMPRTLGLGQEFLGIITSGDMTDALYGKVMKQSYAVLANFSNNSAGYSKRQGEIFVDIVRLMADVEDGKPLPIINADAGGDRTFRLYRQNLAAEYMVRIVERPMTADERQDTFNKLSELVPQYLQAGINIMPVLSKYAPLDAKDRAELVQLSTPQPAQPDPLNQALLDSQAKLQYAQADKLTTEAEQTRQVIGKVGPEKESIIVKNQAQAVKLLSDAGKDDGAMTEKDEAQLSSTERMHREKLHSGERMHFAGLSNSEKLMGMKAQQKPETKANV